MANQSESHNCCGVNTNEAHPDHTAEINRINRIKGQLDGIRRMIEERKYCPDIITQTAAVRSAIASLETAILEKHLASCVHAAMSEGGRDAEAKLSELVEIFKRAIR